MGGWFPWETEHGKLNLKLHNLAVNPQTQAEIGVSGVTVSAQEVRHPRENVQGSIPEAWGIHTLIRTIISSSFPRGTWRPGKFFLPPWVRLHFLVHWRSQMKGSHILYLYLWYLSGHHAAKLYDNYVKIKKGTYKRYQTNMTTIISIWINPQSLPGPSGLEIDVLNSTCYSKLPGSMKS